MQGRGQRSRHSGWDTTRQSLHFRASFPNFIRLPHGTHDSGLITWGEGKREESKHSCKGASLIWKEVLHLASSWSYFQKDYSTQRWVSPQTKSLGAVNSKGHGVPPDIMEEITLVCVCVWGVLGEGKNQNLNFVLETGIFLSTSRFANRIKKVIRVSLLPACSPFLIQSHVVLSQCSQECMIHLFQIWLPDSCFPDLSHWPRAAE